MKISLEKIVTDLEQALTTELHQEDFLLRYNAAMQLIEKATSEFLALLHRRKLKEQDEIHILKKLKPAIDARRIEEGMRFNFLNNLPIGTLTEKMSYWQEELKGLQALFRRHSFYYQYYKNGFEELDQLYFVRSQVHPPLPVPEIPEAITEFYHPISYLFAQFTAYERLQIFVLDHLAALQPERDNPTVARTGAVDLKWTGEAVNAVELAYGLWLTGQLNHGNASLNQIVRWLEVNCGVSIGIAQRRFVEISTRKRISITRYIDQMKNEILKKVENSG